MCLVGYVQTRMKGAGGTMSLHTSNPSLHDPGRQAHAEPMRQQLTVAGGGSSKRIEHHVAEAYTSARSRVAAVAALTTEEREQRCPLALVRGDPRPVASRCSSKRCALPRLQMLVIWSPRGVRPRGRPPLTPAAVTPRRLADETTRSLFRSWPHKLRVRRPAGQPDAPRGLWAPAKLAS